MNALRLWLVVLTLALCAAVALVVCLPRSLVAEIDRAEQTHLEHGRRAAALLLRLSSRKRIDTAALMASDAVLMESLDEATRGPPDLQIVHRTVQERLKFFNEQMKVELVMAADAHGRVIARVGLDAAAYKDGIEGYPLVADALRGLRGDDTWAIGGKLYRVVASPVVDRDHYAGVIVVGQEVTAELADSLKKAVGAEVALLLRGRVIASTSALPILDQLPIAATSARPDAPPMIVGGYSIVFGSFPGEESEQALFALCAARRDAATLPGLVTQLAGSDSRALPLSALAIVGGAGLVLLVFSLVLVSTFGSGPIARLARDAQALSRGEIARLSEIGRSGGLRTVAHAVNSTLDRISGRVRAEQRAASEAQLDAAIRTEPSSPVRIAAPVEVAPLRASAPAYESPHERARDLEGYSAAADLSESLSVSSHSSVLTPLPPPAPPLYSQAVETGELAMERAESRPRGFEEPTSVESPSEARLIASADDSSEDVESDFRRVYDEFVSTRETCGETLEGVSFDKFVLKLRQNRSQLIQRYGCTGVRFQVYIRAGKTALKATPIT